MPNRAARASGLLLAAVLAPSAGVAAEGLDLGALLPGWIHAIVLAAFGLDDPALVAEARAAYAAQLRANIRADGSTLIVEMATRDRVKTLTVTIGATTSISKIATATNADLTVGDSVVVDLGRDAAVAKSVLIVE